MKASQMMPSKYLKKEDVEQPALCTIKKLGQADVSQDESGDMKWTVYFNELPKPMVLNVSNINALSEALGEETDRWLGKQIVVYVDPNVMFSGKKVGGLRLRAPKRGAAPAPAAATSDAEADRIAKQQSAKASGEFVDDETIPF